MIIAYTERKPKHIAPELRTFVLKTRPSKNDLNWFKCP